MIAPRLLATSIDDDGLERREYDVDGERVVALLHDGQLVKIVRNPPSPPEGSAEDEAFAWTIFEESS